MKDKCEKCGAIENLTRDHIIPKWLYKRLDNLHFGIKVDTKFKKNLGQTNIQTLCAICNSEKGGRLEMSHEITEQIFPWIEDLYNDMNRARLKKRINRVTK